MKFVIRDDDLNYFSTPDDIREWYADIFAEGITVGFASIPFMKPESDVYTGGAAFEETEYPISGNTELTAYVKAEPHIEILQHGTTHETVQGVFEYAKRLPATETLRGRQELERAFETEVSVFVPPHDWIGVSGIHAVEYARMNIIRGRGAGLRNYIFRLEYILIFLRMALRRLRYFYVRKMPAYPYVLNFGRHKEVCSYRLEDTDISEGLEYAHRKNGIFVVVMHVHFITPEKKEQLYALITRARELGAEFVAPSIVFNS